MQSIPDRGMDLAHQVWYEPEGDGCLTTTITNAVATVLDVDVSELDPLQYSIDTDSLENLFCPLSSGRFAAIGDLSFVYSQVVVCVHSTGSVQIYKQ